MTVDQAAPQVMTHNGCPVERQVAKLIARNSLICSSHLFDHFVGKGEKIGQNL